MDYQLLLFLRILLVAALYMAILQVVFVARRELRQEVKAAAQGASPTRSVRVVGHLVVLDRGSTQLQDNEVYDIGEITTLGRELTNNIPIESGYVSKVHARVLFNAADSTLSVEDLGSSNGTYVDGRKITGRVAVSPGSTLQIGDARFKFMA